MILFLLLSNFWIFWFVILINTMNLKSERVITNILYIFIFENTQIKLLMTHSKVKLFPFHNNKCHISKEICCFIFNVTWHFWQGKIMTVQNSFQKSSKTKKDGCMLHSFELFKKRKENGLLLWCCMNANNMYLVSKGGNSNARCS